ncbi:insulinase family protein, partial [Candidatus Roizmanbacteria bacterium]|nr:insulinase family protein [Candidatus Roizmanbacteria bacterium]
NFKKFTLTNKVTVIVQHISWVKSLCVYFYVGAGSRYETENTAGLAHFLEHMLFEGTKRFPSSKKLVEYIEKFGGRSGARTDKEYVVYYTKVPDKQPQVAFDYLTEILFHSILENKAIEKEKMIVLEELKRKEDNPEVEIMDLWMEWVWGKSQWPGRSTLGERKTIDTISKVKLQEYMKNLYTPENMVISVIGNLSSIKVKEQVLKSIGKIQSNPKILIVKKPVFKQKKTRVRIIPSKSKQNQLILGFVTGVSYKHVDYFPTLLLADILSRGVSSRLIHKLVYDLGIAYSVWTDNWSFSDTGLFYIQGGFSTENIEKALEIIIFELNSLKREKVTNKELSEAKIKGQADLIFSLESPDALANFYASQQFLERRILSPAQISDKIDKVTSNDVQKVARKYLKGANLSLLIKGPVSSTYTNVFEKILSKVSSD